MAAAESAALAPTPWEHWARLAEALFGHSLDGDEADNGYCMDLAYEACAAGTSVETYVRNCRAKQNYRVRLYANGAGFPPGHERKVARSCYAVINAHTGTPVLSRATEPESDRWHDHHQADWRVPQDAVEVAPELRQAFLAAPPTVRYLLPV